MGKLASPFNQIRWRTPDWILLDISWTQIAAGRCVRKVGSIDDETKKLLAAVSEGKELKADELKKLKTRNLTKIQTYYTYKVTKGPRYSVVRRKEYGDITADMIKS